MNTLSVGLALIHRRGCNNMDLLPKLTFTGIADYLAVTIGIALGFAIFSAPMEQLKSGLRKNGGV